MNNVYVKILTYLFFCIPSIYARNFDLSVDKILKAESFCISRKVNNEWGSFSEKMKCDIFIEYISSQKQFVIRTAKHKLYKVVSYYNINENEIEFNCLDENESKCTITYVDNKGLNMFTTQTMVVGLLPEIKNKLYLRLEKQQICYDVEDKTVYVEMPMPKGILEGDKPQTSSELIPSYNFIMLNGGFTTLPDYSYGLTYAWVKRAGFYFSAMSNFKFRFNSDYVGDSSGYVNGTYPLYSGKKEYTKITATTGLMIRFCEPLYMYLGGGYGYRGMYYETVGNEWVAIQGNHCIYHGGVGEIGLIGNIYGFSLSLGLSVITDLHNYYPEAKVGIGYCF